MTTSSTSVAPRADRPYDLVLFGATGFTGRLVAEYLVRTYGAGRELRWALAGRNRQKLEDVRAQLATLDTAARALPILVGDAADRATLLPLTRAARVVVTTVGPYALHGRELVAACVETGTDYCDLTGETQFVRDMIDRHHEHARATGARIVHCCGFDSIPSDLGTLVLQDEMRRRHGVPCAEVKFFMGEATGGVSGGTIASMFNLLGEVRKDKALRRLVGDPYALNPDRAQRGPDGGDQRGVRFDADLGRWTGPFVMAAINARIVRRSHALLGWPWGKDFRYGEVWSFGKGPKGWLTAAGLAAGLAGFTAAAYFSPTRALLARRLPAPGEGPSQEERERGYFVVRLVGTARTPAGPVRLLETVRGKADPGYGETAKMLSEAAVCLARDDVKAEGGVLTPASCMGLRLVERLRAAGMSFDVEAL